MIVIFFVAKNSHTGKVACIVLVQNPILPFIVHVIFATFAADAEGCHCSEMLVNSFSLWKNFIMHRFMNVEKTVSVLFAYE